MKVFCKSISDLSGKEYVGDLRISKFTELLKKKWLEADKKPKVFRYKTDNLQERFIDISSWSYQLILNPDRALNRRTPELINDMNQPFNEDKFNFTKVSEDEILFSVGNDENDPALHSFIVNVSPISKYHTLFCPFLNQKLPQSLTYDSVEAIVTLLLVAQDRELKVAFNSLCAMASVNHLHFHLLWVKNDFAVEKTVKTKLTQNLKYVIKYPVPAFFMSISEGDKATTTEELFKVIKYLQDNCIAHNVLLCTAPTGTLDIYVFPRKNTAGVKNFKHFNVASLEFSGYFPVFDEGSFTSLNSDDIENIIKKWKYDDFDKLREQISKK